MSTGPKFFLTRRALNDLKEIYEYSLEQWGEITADTYISRLYDEMRKVANSPETGRIRQDRSYPYLMAPIEKHYAIYKKISGGIIIATILHNMRDIESIMRSITPALTDQVTEIEKRIKPDNKKKN